MQPTIELAKSSNTLNKLTFVLLYATDFADRLEKEIIPALKAGFVVLSDRYIFTALARAGVRGVDRQWLRNLYGFAIAPHLVFYLKIDVEDADRPRPRVARHGLLGIGHGPEARRRHLRQLPRLPEQAAARIQRRWPTSSTSASLDARRSVDRIQDELRKQVAAFLEPTRTSAEADARCAGL